MTIGTCWATATFTRSGKIITPHVSVSDYRLYVRHTCVDLLAFSITVLSETRDCPPQLARILHDQTGIEVVSEWLQ